VDAHNAGHGIGVGNTDRIIAERAGARDEINRIGRPAQEGKAAHEAQLDKRRGGWRRQVAGFGMTPFGREWGFRH